MLGAQGMTTPDRPWHLWLIGSVGSLWSVVGAGSFLLTQLNVEAVMSRFPPEQRGYFASWPFWADAFWALSVVGGMTGCILVLFQNRLAYHALLASVIGASIAHLGGLWLLGGMEVMGGPDALALTGVPIVVAGGLAWYAGAMSRKGVLR